MLSGWSLPLSSVEGKVDHALVSGREGRRRRELEEGGGRVIRVLAVAEEKNNGSLWLSV